MSLTNGNGGSVLNRALPAILAGILLAAIGGGWSFGAQLAAIHAELAGIKAQLADVKAQQGDTNARLLFLERRERRQ